MEERETYAWVAAASTLLLALIGWGRAWVTRRQDLAESFTVSMLKRVAALEERNDAAQTRLDAAELEAAVCGRDLAVVRSQMVSMQEVGRLQMIETGSLREELRVARIELAASRIVSDSLREDLRVLRAKIEKEP